MVIILIGVSGSGKSTIGKALARHLGWQFLDADDFHSRENILKMEKGISLTDRDRIPWLKALNNTLVDLCTKKTDAILACSALKESYRGLLSENTAQCIKWVYLKADFETIEKRLSRRKDHFFNPQLLKSQFDTLEEPDNAIYVDCNDDSSEIVKVILNSMFS